MSIQCQFMAVEGLTGLCHSIYKQGGKVADERIRIL